MTPSLMVIGAGIAGINCALNAAQYGIKVLLIDDTHSIGGMMARLDKTFPTNDCSICIEAPKMYEVDNHPNIEILTNTQVKRVKQINGQFEVKLVKKPTYVDEEKCTGCGACVDACPVSRPDAMDGKIGGKRKLISMPFPQAIPNTVYVDVSCRTGEMREHGACIGGCEVDCSQCRECPIAYCVKACEKEGKKAITLWQSPLNKTISVHSIVVATGILNAEPKGDLLGYERFENVITNTEFERLMNAGGPTNGEIIRPSDQKHAKKIAWIQCAGRGLSENKGLPYCSKVCCMISTKQTLIAKEHDASVEATIFYNDLKAYGKGFWNFHETAVKNGIHFVKGRPYEVIEEAESKNLILRYEDIEKGEIKNKTADLVVLATGLKAADRNKRLAKTLKIDMDAFGFFKERDPLSAPLETNVKGIFICGGATGPIDISESVVQACAASMKAILNIHSRNHQGLKGD